MSSETRTVKASCLCGKARYDLTLPTSQFPLKSFWCHCNSCRQKTGALCFTFASPPEGWTPPKELFHELIAYNFSDRLTMYHCSTCGSTMITDCKPSGLDNRGQHWDIVTGTLETADGVFKLSGHEYIADTLDGGFSDFLHTINDKQLERWPHRPNQGEQLPLYWHSPDRPTITPKADDRLHCHCHCDGVSFYLSRPSDRSKNALDHSAWWLRDNGRKFLAGNCSCNSCRLDLGTEFQSWCFIPTVDISLDEEGKEPYKVPFGTLKGYQSSPDVTRYHCGVCGASVFFTTDEREDLVDISVGVLGAPEGARAETWLDWRMGRLSYREDAIPRAESLILALEDGQRAWEEQQKKK